MAADTVATHPLVGALLVHGEPILREYGYPAIVVCNLAEGVGIPMPGQTTLITAALLATSGDFQIVWVVTLALAATIAGNCMGYWVGRLGGRKLVQRLPMRPERLARLERFFSHRGLLLVVFARFLDGTRQTVPLIAGSMNMPWWRFLVATVVGSLAWVSLWGIGGFLAAPKLHQFLLQLHGVTQHWVWLALVPAIAWAGWHYLRRRRR